MAKTITLNEYSFLQTHDKDDNQNPYIEPKEFEVLERFILQNEDKAQYLKLIYKKGYKKVLQAQNYVGLIQLKNGTTIEILPKTNNSKTNENSKTTLIKMLKTLRNSPFKNLGFAHLKNIKNMSLFEVFISMFLEELASLVKKGIRFDYVTKEENLHFLKGKLHLSKQLQYNSVHKERFFVEYEEFSINRAENRLIKTTLSYLYKKSTSNKNQQRIREFLFVFDEVEKSKNIEMDFSKTKQNRQMKHYTQVLLWCKTFLLHKSFTPYKGDEVAFALLFDMNKLFESYVFDYLKKRGEFESIIAQDSGHHLAFLNGITPKFKLKPDIVINKSSIDKKTIVIDTKWKLLDEEKTHNGISQADMYQMFAYGKKYKCESILLIYPKHTKVKKQCYTYYKQNLEEEKLKVEILFFDIEKENEIHKVLQRYIKYKCL
jgi:5-methylcytosine-specific restriction enzyme subunit McrC